MERGYALIAAAMQFDGWLQFSGVMLDGGFIRQEVERIMKEKPNGIHA